MSRQLQTLIGIVAIVAPGLHLGTDMLEWVNGGFSSVQLWLNYVAFLPMPFLLVGLYAAQLPDIRSLGLLGALLYGMAFIYFAHTTLYALSEGIPNYEALWSRLGPPYTVHGGLMVVGGLLFGVAALQANRVPRWSVLLFLVGLVLNLILALVPLPEILETAGSTLRNLGLMGIGLGLLRAEAQQG
jgi:hypothetical protein